MAWKGCDGQVGECVLGPPGSQEALDQTPQVDRRAILSQFSPTSLCSGCLTYETWLILPSCVKIFKSKVGSSGDGAVLGAAFYSVRVQQEDSCL